MNHLISFRKIVQVHLGQNKFIPKNIEKGTINYDKKTAEYKIYIKPSHTKKAIAITNIVTTGFGKAYKKDWFEKQNSVTIFTPKDGSVYDIYKNYGVALVSYPSTNGNPAILMDLLSNPDTMNILRLYSVMGNDYIDISVLKTFAWSYSSNTKFYNSSAFDDTLPCEFLKEYDRELSVNTSLRMGVLLASFLENVGSINKTNHYNIIISIRDSDGNVLLKKEVGSPTDETKPITFEDVNSTVIAKLDNDAYTIKIDEIYLTYGDITIKNEKKDVGQFISYSSFDKSKLQKIKLNTLCGNSFTLDEVKDKIENAKEKKAAMIARKNNDYANCLNNGEREIIRSICLGLKNSKTISKEELIKTATVVWQEIYNSTKISFEADNEFSDIQFPEYNENYVLEIYESKVESILITTDKKGNLILTPAGKKIK